MATGAAAAAVVLALVSLTVVTAAIVREPGGSVGRHYASLVLPLGLVPVLVALALAGPPGTVPLAVVIVLLQALTAVAENHVVGRIDHLHRRRTGRGRRRRSHTD